MAVGKCRSCGGEVAFNARTCPHCGRSGIPHAGAAKLVRYVWMTWLVVMVGGAIFAAFT